MLGMICIGCKSEHPDGTEFKEEINHVDSSGTKQGLWKIYADAILVAKGSYRIDWRKYWLTDGDFVIKRGAGRISEK